MDFDEVLAAEISSKPENLLIDRILAALEEDQAKKVRLALENRNLASNAAIARALTAMGYSISEGAVLNWRQRNGIKR